MSFFNLSLHSHLLRYCPNLNNIYAVLATKEENKKEEIIEEINIYILKFIFIHLNYNKRTIFISIFT